ncbi:acyl-CoA N-acyltransferase, partial [Aspergillus uvarum CBS 121591]
ATESDAPALAALYFTCFTNAAHRRVFPPTPEMHAWWTANLRRKIASGRSVVLKVVDVDAEPLPAGAGSGIDEGSESESDSSALESGSGSDGEADAEPGLGSGDDADPGVVKEGRRRRRKGRIVAFADILGTNPAYRGQGLGSRLLAWGIARARAEGRQIYLCASREGRSLYVRHGFVRVSEGEVV